MLFLYLLFVVVAAFVAFYLVLPFGLVVASFFTKEKKPKQAQKQLDFACVITAYRSNIKLTTPLIESLLRQTHSNHLIYLVADHCEVDAGFPERVVVLQPTTQLGSKVKSFIYAVDHFQRKHDAVVIFDPDNVAAKNFLSVLNNYMYDGFKAVQGRRTAKNLDSKYARGDATGEIYKNYIERYVPFLLGSSPSIAGSGMAVETALFKDYLACDKLVDNLEHSKIIVEDKVLQNVIVSKGYQIAFAVDAVLYDEKVTTGKQAQLQRSRWLYSYFANATDALRLVLKGITEFNINAFIIGLTTSAPPMFLLVLGALLLTPVSFFVSKALFWTMIGAIAIFIGNIFFVLWLSNAPGLIWKTIWAIPFFIWRQFLGLFQMKLSRKQWLTTENKKALTLQEIEEAVPH